jgi:F0F1-type ATP synthase membrane subunit b/b'
MIMSNDLNISKEQLEAWMQPIFDRCMETVKKQLEEIATEYYTEVLPWSDCDMLSNTRRGILNEVTEYSDLTIGEKKTLRDKIYQDNKEEINADLLRDASEMEKSLRETITTLRKQLDRSMW